MNCIAHCCNSQNAGNLWSIFGPNGPLRYCGALHHTTRSCPLSFVCILSPSAWKTTFCLSCKLWFSAVRALCERWRSTSGMHVSFNEESSSVRFEPRGVLVTSFVRQNICTLHRSCLHVVVVVTPVYLEKCMLPRGTCIASAANVPWSSLSTGSGRRTTPRCSVP